MNRSTTVLMFLLGLAATAAAEPRPPSPAPAAPADAMPLVVSPAWLAAHLADPGVVVLHVGEPASYATHIAGARRVDLSDISVSMQGKDGLHLELPPPDDLRRRLEALGISTGSRIVVCPADELASATRVVFTLYAAGLGDRTALLDGGLPAWLRDHRAVTAAAPPARTGKLAPLAMRPIVVDANTVLSRLGKPGFAVIDARDRAYYDGTQTGQSHDRKHRTGHIAGALSVPFDSVFDEQGVLRPADDLRARFTKAGVKPGDTVIGYCHIGQQATAMLFAARRAGYRVMLYDGSFEDWSLNHPAYPVETSAGAAPRSEQAP
ncbi:MAG TPA: rhodanese-like domain-containing protein [Kofleriaceae bacterium]|jgi:thiosulfate/3-mercaptopyruvate sulfurtransferase|nr:rhodanese-like domain-containing protein [Kofleriaceae bacterium]